MYETVLPSFVLLAFGTLLAVAVVAHDKYHHLSRPTGRHRRPDPRRARHTSGAVR